MPTVAVIGAGKPRMDIRDTLRLIPYVLLARPTRTGGSEEPARRRL